MILQCRPTSCYRPISGFNQFGREYLDKYYPIIKSFTVRDNPLPKRRGPRPYTLAWFRSYKPPLPPRLQTPFPFNIVRVHRDLKQDLH